MDVLERWRPEGWRRPGRVVAAHRRPLDSTADADIVNAGGAALAAAVFDQFGRARFLVQPYVGNTTHLATLPVLADVPRA